jgi:putative colanic acid biosynthesis UDP-glucose lipid carrier transferase
MSKGMFALLQRRPHRNMRLLEAVADGSGPGVANAARRMPDGAADERFAADARTLFLAALRALDMGVVCAGALLAYWVYLGGHNPQRSEKLQLVIGCLIAANLLHFAQVYSIESLRKRLSHVQRLASAWTLTMLAVVASVYFTHSAGEISRGWILLWAMFGFCGLIVVRIAGWKWLGAALSQERFLLKVAVVGEDRAADFLAQHLERSSSGDSRVVGVFNLSEAPIGAPEGARRRPGISDLLRLARRERIDEIAISMPCPESDKLGAALAKLSTIPINVKLCTHIAMGEGPERMGLLLPPVAVLERPLAGWPMLVKRCMDVTISGLLLIFFAPLLVMIAVLVKLDSPGPVLFRQQRFGFNQNRFIVYKFRTMRVAASREDDVAQARRNDPRVTRIGRFLRRSSLDELPQLLNVLAGTMSLVGPRPHAVAHDEHYAKLIDGYLARHRVKPGITGWAQVNGFRGETDTTEKMARRVEYDLYYIDHWSPFFDLYILARTAFVGFRGDNAY